MTCSSGGLIDVHWFRAGRAPSEWELFCRLAHQAYAAQGCEEALSWLDDLTVSSLDDLHFCTLSRSGKPLGGFSVRALPVEDLLAPHCWPDSTQVRVALRGIVGSALVAEASTAWSLDLVVSPLLAAEAVTALTLTGCRWMVATSAQHSIDLWLSSGASRVKAVPAVQYPDSRYRTELLLWDRDQFVTQERGERWAS
ncbi:hypothetical protein GOPIP_044_00920 [Gordonia polyisoprenivorans NBRC 16320 = JCM 10675]|nr:hypothetical protein GOPIP_044_00920 [Gordonia polyisoprenivorans NBRC 16320 = JCM 10675]